jgi:hypothetical protein
MVALKMLEKSILLLHFVCQAMWENLLKTEEKVGNVCCAGH